MLIGLNDATEPGTRRAATPPACINVGELRSLATRSPVTMFSPTIPVYLDRFPSFATWCNGLQTVLLHRALQIVLLQAFHLYSLSNPVLYSVPQCSGSACVSSACFSLRYFFRYPRRDRFVPSARQVSRVPLRFSYHFCAPVLHKLRRVACKTIASGYSQLTKRCIHAFTCD